MLGMEILVIIGLILLLLVLWIISVQRKFAVMDGNIQNAMNQIGVQISSRFDALFAVLDLMKGYAADRYLADHLNGIIRIYYGRDAP